MRKLTPVVLLCGVLALGGCATTTNPDTGEVQQDTNRTAAGAIIGGIIGGVLANNTGKRSTGKTAAGVVTGAVVGGVIGKTMDDKEKKLRDIAAEQKDTAAERDANAMEVERLRDDMLRVSVSSEASFDFGKASLKPEFKPTLDKVAGVLRDDANVRIFVVGHTDSVGSDSYNQTLSVNRAQVVSDYLVSHGVMASQITVEGHGESEPRASNDTAEGRAQNRRVEIYLQQLNS